MTGRARGAGLVVPGTLDRGRRGVVGSAPGHRWLGHSNGVQPAERADLGRFGPGSRPGKEVGTPQRQQGQAQKRPARLLAQVRQTIGVAFLVATPFLICSGLLSPNNGPIIAPFAASTEGHRPDGSQSKTKISAATGGAGYHSLKNLTMFGVSKVRCGEIA